MNVFESLWAALNSPLAWPRARPAAAPGPPPAKPRRAAASPLRAALGAGSGGSSERRSRDPQTYHGLVTSLEEYFAGYPADNRVRLIKLLRLLTQRDEDLAGAQGDLVSLANAGHTLEFVGSKRAVRRARAEIEALARRLYPEGGGIDGFLNNQVGECYKTGATSVEWYPTKRRDGVAGVAVVQAEDVRVTREDDGSLSYVQKVNGVDFVLDPLTFCYAPVQTDGAGTHGVPLCLSALEALERKKRLTANTDRVIDLMKTLAVVTASLPAPTPGDVGLESEDDPGWPDAKAKYYQDAVRLMIDLAPRGLFVGPSGTDFNVVNVTQSLAGLAETVLENQRRIWGGARTLGFMRGHMDSTTEALAKVVYPILEALAGTVQQALARQLEFGFNLHLRLRGIPAQVWVRFEQAESAFAVDQATAEKTRMETDEIGKRVFGKRWWNQASQRWDIAEDDGDQAPDDWMAASAPPAPAPGAPPAPDAPPEEAKSVRVLALFDRDLRAYRPVRGRAA